MKIMHISDLHLGRSLNGFDMYLDQKYILEEIIKAIKVNEPKYLLIAGDIYDKYIPAVEAVNLLSDFLSQLSQNKDLRIVIISGNHDQADRLNYLGSFLKRNNIYLVTNVKESLSPIIFDDDKIAICGIPYLNIGKLRQSFGEEESEVSAHQKIVDNFLNTVDKEYLKICLIHNFVLGGEKSDSERILSVGALEELPSNLFKAFDYVALGHLHKRQKIASNVFYSGSPLKYSEKEYQNKNGYIIYDTETNEILFKNLTPLKDIIYINDYFDNLESYEEAKKHYVYVELKDENRIIDVAKKVRQIFPFCVNIIKNYKEQSTNQIVKKNGTISDVEIFKDFYKTVSGNEVSKEELKIFTSILEEVEGDE